MSATRTYFEYTNVRGRKYYYDTENGTTTFTFPSDGVIFEPISGNVIHCPPNVKAMSGRRGSKPSVRLEPLGGVQPRFGTVVSYPAVQGAAQLTAPLPGVPTADSESAEPAPQSEAVPDPASRPSPAPPPEPEPRPPSEPGPLSAVPPAEGPSVEVKAPLEPTPQATIHPPTAPALQPIPPVSSQPPSLPSGPPQPLLGAPPVRVHPLPPAGAPAKLIPVIPPPPAEEPPVTPTPPPPDPPVTLTLTPPRPSEPPVTLIPPPPAAPVRLLGPPEPTPQPVILVVPPSAPPVVLIPPPPSAGQPAPVSAAPPSSQTGSPFPRPQMHSHEYSGTQPAPTPTGFPRRFPGPTANPPIQSRHPAAFPIPSGAGQRTSAKPARPGAEPEPEPSAHAPAPSPELLVVVPPPLPKPDRDPVRESPATDAEPRRRAAPETEQPSAPRDPLAAPPAIPPRPDGGAEPPRKRAAGPVDVPAWPDGRAQAPQTVRPPAPRDLTQRPDRGTKRQQSGRAPRLPPIGAGLDDSEVDWFGTSQSQKPKARPRQGSVRTSSRSKPATVLIHRPLSIHEILGRRFSLPDTFTRAQLFAALKKWDMQAFAEKNFRKHHVGAFIQKKWIPLSTITSFQDTPIKKPLLQAVPTELKEEGALLFDLLLQYTGVKPCPHPQTVLTQILRGIQEHRQFFVDEFFFQLVKQTTNNRTVSLALKTWQLFLIVASIFPCTSDNFDWIVAHLAASTPDADKRILNLALLTFIRFQARRLLGTTLDWAAEPAMIERLPDDTDTGRPSFGVSLYELMWCQRRRFPRLPIPYCLHYMVMAITDRGLPKSATLFRETVPVEDARAEANQELYAVPRFGAKVISNLLLVWLRDLPDPIIPVDMDDEFIVMATDGRFLGFVEKMPQVHRLTLLYIVGFLKTLSANTSVHGLSVRDIAAIFGPPFINTARTGRPSDHLNDLAVAFVTKLIADRDTTIVFPLHDDYLDQANEPKKPAAVKPKGRKRSGSTTPTRTPAGVPRTGTRQPPPPDPDDDDSDPWGEDEQREQPGRSPFT